MCFILIFLPKAILFHIWRLKCICVFLLFTKKYGAEVCNFLDFMALLSQTYMKWPLAFSILESNRKMEFGVPISQLLESGISLIHNNSPFISATVSKIWAFKSKVWKILERPSLTGVSVNINANFPDGVTPIFSKICNIKYLHDLWAYAKNFDPQSLCSFFTLTCHFHMEI